MPELMFSNKSDQIGQQKLLHFFSSSRSVCISMVCVDIHMHENCIYWKYEVFSATIRTHQYGLAAHQNIQFRVPFVYIPGKRSELHFNEKCPFEVH